MYKLLTFHDPNLMSLFHCLGRLSKESVQVQASFMTFVTNLFLCGEGLLAPRPFCLSTGALIKDSYQHHLCGLVVRVPGYRSRGPGSIPDTTKYSEQ
jgi:hypothetical protein